MNNIKIKGNNQTYKFKVLPFKRIENSGIRNCIAIVAFYKYPSVYSMFHIEKLDLLNSLAKTFDLSITHLLFVKELSEKENAEEIINDIKEANPEHDFN